MHFVDVSDERPGNHVTRNASQVFDLALFTRSLNSVLKVIGSIDSYLKCPFYAFFSAGDVSRETSPAEKSEAKRMFSQATFK